MSVPAMPIRCTAAGRSMTPTSDDSRYSSKAAVIYRPATAGKAKESLVSSVKVDVACEDGADRIGLGS